MLREPGPGHAPSGNSGPQVLVLAGATEKIYHRGQTSAVESHSPAMVRLENSTAGTTVLAGLSVRGVAQFQMLAGDTTVAGLTRPLAVRL